MMGRSARALLCAIIAWPGVAAATDVYTFFDAECRRTSGILVSVDETTVVMVDLEGRFVRRERASIHSAVLHQPLENPLATMQIDAALADYLRVVWTDDEQPSFTGWATSFYDDLYIFLDLEGKTHVIEPGDVRRLDDAEVTLGAHRLRVFAPAKLGFPPEIVPCSRVAPTVDELPPSRVMADRIKLGDHFAKLEGHYRALSDFEERTKVYATPFVFDEASRVGLIYQRRMELPIPFYFRWSSGRPYRFQTETVIGNAPNRALPFGKPTFSASSDLKSHFFHAAFVGHFVSLPAGSNPFLLADLDGTAPTQTTVEPGYNYVILMGADYWRLSASAGPAYLANRVVVRDVLDARNVLAQNASIGARLRYQTPWLSARVLYFRSRQSGPMTDVLEEEAMDEPDATYSVRSDAIRVGATVTVWPGVTLEADEMITIGRYRERMFSDPIDVSFQMFETSAILSADFGRYVTVKGYGRLVVRRHDVTLPMSMEETRVDPIFGGGLEFVF